MPPAFVRLSTIIGFVATQLVLFAVVLEVSVRAANARFTKAVTGAPDDAFPIVVVTRDREGRAHAAALRHHELAAFRTTNADVSFTIIAAEEDRLRAEVEGATRARGRGDSRLWFATFETRMRDDGTQEVEVFASGSDDYENRSWYEAHGATFRPLRHRYYFGGGVGIATLPFCGGSVVLNVLLWAGARFSYRSWKARRARIRSAAS